MKIALDIHGVIDKKPRFFRELAGAIISAGGEVHILTGKHLANGILEELERYYFTRGVHFTHLFSISDYHKEKGTKMWGDIKNPFMADEDWDRTKADYCREHNIDLCVDDKESYMKYFSTSVALFKVNHISLSDAREIVFAQQKEMEARRLAHAADDGVNVFSDDDFIEQEIEARKAEAILEFEQDTNAKDS